MARTNTEARPPATPIEQAERDHQHPMLGTTPQGRRYCRFCGVMAAEVPAAPAAPRPREDEATGGDCLSLGHDVQFFYEEDGLYWNCARCPAQGFEEK